MSIQDPAEEAEAMERPEAVSPEQGARGNAQASDATIQGTQTTELFSDTELQSYRERWDSVQAGFVDDPKTSVEAADKLVNTLIERLADGFSQERSRLEAQWEEGVDASTEDLRLALQRYRSFFGRLLAA